MHDRQRKREAQRAAGIRFRLECSSTGHADGICHRRAAAPMGKKSNDEGRSDELPGGERRRMLAHRYRAAAPVTPVLPAQGQQA
jgi:hypothetical protein